MATIFSPSAVLSSSATTTTTAKPPPTKPHHLTIPPSKPPANLATTAAATALAAAAILTTAPPSLAEFKLYYGTAASAANYGGYGGNSDKKATAEYTYEVPEGWKEKLVSKIQKGTNGTDSEFYNPKKKAEKEYLTFLNGFPSLAPKDVILNNLALSDVDLQDLIATADGVTSEETKDEKGQIYYVYEINGVGAHSLISVTCAKNKLYAHFVNAPTPDWNRDQDTLRHIHQSFKTGRKIRLTDLSLDGLIYKVLPSIEGETIVIGYMAAALARRGVLVILGTAAPSLLPVGYAGVGPVIFIVPFVHDHPGSVAPLAINALVRRGKCKQSLIPSGVAMEGASKRGVACFLIEGVAPQTPLLGAPYLQFLG